YSLIAKFFPIVSIWETRAHDNIVEPVPEREQKATLVPAPTSAIIVLLFVALLNVSSASATTTPKEPPKPTTLGLSYQVVEQKQETSSAMGGAPGTQSTLENPFASRRSHEEAPVPGVLVLAKLSDSLGAPLSFKPVLFSVRTYF